MCSMTSALAQSLWDFFKYQYFHTSRNILPKGCNVQGIPRCPICGKSTNRHYFLAPCEYGNGQTSAEVRTMLTFLLCYVIIDSTNHSSSQQMLKLPRSCQQRANKSFSMFYPVFYFITFKSIFAVLSQRSLRSSLLTAL